MAALAGLRELDRGLLFTQQTAEAGTEVLTRRDWEAAFYLSFISLFVTPSAPRPHTASTLGQHPFQK